MALIIDRNCGFSHTEATMTREWIFWGKEEWTPETFTFHAYYRARHFAAPQTFAKEGYDQMYLHQQHTPVYMMVVGQRHWWWFRDDFYYTTETFQDPLVIKGLLLQQEQRARNKEEKARAAASGEPPPKKARTSRKNQSSTQERSDENQNSYIILGVTPTASPAEIKAAYRKCITEYHPDKVHALGVELQKLATKMSQEINKAYEILRKKHRF